MDYTIDDKPHTVSIKGGRLVIDGRERTINILYQDRDRVEILLDGTYHSILYGDNNVQKMTVEVDGSPITLIHSSNLDDIVYMNSGGADAASLESSLFSQIPGKVVSVAVSTGQDVSEGDLVCVLESMKMQVSVKAHAAGRVKTIRAKVGDSVAKGDVIAEIE